MKIFEKRRSKNGRRDIFLFGIRALTYRLGQKSPKVKGSGNVLKGIPSHTDLAVFGNDNHVAFGDTDRRFAALVSIGAADGRTAHNCTLLVGANCSCERARFCLFDNGSTITIGEDSMISYDVEFRCSDSHAILNEEGRAVNLGQFIHIGKHCWIGARSTILKNVAIPDGSIVAAGAVVTASSVRDAGTDSVVLAGNPARIVKRGITWDRHRPHDLM